MKNIFRRLCVRCVLGGRVHPEKALKFLERTLLVVWVAFIALLGPLFGLVLISLVKERDPQQILIFCCVVVLTPLLIAFHITASRLWLYLNDWALRRRDLLCEGTVALGGLKKAMDHLGECQFSPEETIFFFGTESEGERVIGYADFLEIAFYDEQRKLNELPLLIHTELLLEKSFWESFGKDQFKSVQNVLDTITAFEEWAGYFCEIYQDFLQLQNFLEIGRPLRLEYGEKLRILIVETESANAELKKKLQDFAVEHESLSLKDHVAFFTDFFHSGANRNGMARSKTRACLDGVVLAICTKVWQANEEDDFLVKQSDQTRFLKRLSVQLTLKKGDKKVKSDMDLQRRFCLWLANAVAQESQVQFHIVSTNDPDYMM